MAQQLDRRIRLVYYDPTRDPYSFAIDGVDVATYTPADVPDGTYSAARSDGSEWLGFTWSSSSSVRWVRAAGAQSADLVVTATQAGFSGGGWVDPWPAAIVWKDSLGAVLRIDFAKSDRFNRFGEESSFGSGSGLGWSVDTGRTALFGQPPTGWATGELHMFDPPDPDDPAQSRDVWASQLDSGGSEAVGTITADAAVIQRTLLREYTIRYQVGVDQRARVYDEEGRLWNVRSVRELGRRKLMLLDCEYLGA